MACDFCRRLREFIIHAVHGILVLCGTARDDALRHGSHAQAAAHNGIVGNCLRDDVLRAVQCIFRRINTLFCVDVTLGEPHRVNTLFLRQNFLCERL